MKTGLVLGGGSARGAYEAGVLSYVRTELARELDRQVPIDIIAGTSVGALNAAYLAATAGDHVLQGRGMVDTWRSLQIDEFLLFGFGDVVRMLREFTGRAPIRWSGGLTGGLINPAGLLHVVGRAIPWRGVSQNLRSGALDALAVSATHVASGRTIVFVQTRTGRAPPWGRDPHVAAHHVRIGPKHAMASAALPVLFPSVRIGGELYVDGGLRHSLPLAPALRLGAERVIVVPLRHKTFAPEPSILRTPRAQARAVASAPFLVGKTLNALLLDRTDQDIDQLVRINSMIDAGTAVFGPTFVDALNSGLMPHRNTPVRRVRHMVVRPSMDIGKLAAEYCRSAEFQRRVKGRLVGSVIRHLADSEAEDEADLVSYLLFDGGFADILIQLGYADARSQLAEWKRFYAEDESAA